MKAWIVKVVGFLPSTVAEVNQGQCLTKHWCREDELQMPKAYSFGAFLLPDSLLKRPQPVGSILNLSQIRQRCWCYFVRTMCSLKPLAVLIFIEWMLSISAILAFGINNYLMYMVRRGNSVACKMFSGVTLSCPFLIHFQRDIMLDSKCQQTWLSDDRVVLVFSGHDNFSYYWII